MERVGYQEELPIVTERGMGMLKVAICDDSRADVEQLESALGALRDNQIDYDVYFSAGNCWNTLPSTKKTIIYIFSTSKCRT